MRRGLFSNYSEQSRYQPRRGGPVFSGGDRAQHVDAEEVEVVTEKEVEREQLADYVDEEQQLDGQVDGRQVVAMATAAPAQAGARQTALQTDVT